MIEKISESKSQFFEKINKIDKPLTRLIKIKTEVTQRNKIRNERGAIIIDKEIQRVVRKYEQLYAKKVDDLDKMDKFLQTYNLSKLNENQRISIDTLPLVKLKQ